MLQRVKDYLLSLKPGNTPPGILAEGEIRPIQELILHSTYLFGSIAAVVALLFFVPSLAATQGSAALLVSVVAVAFILFTLWRSAPYDLRGQVLIIMLFAASAVIFLKVGITVVGAASLFGYILYTTILFGGKAGARAFVLSSFALGFLAFAFRNGMISAPANTAGIDVTQPANWVQYVIPLMAVIGVLAVAIRILVNELASKTTSYRVLSNNMAYEQQKMAEMLQKGTSRIERREQQLRTAFQISRDFSTMLDPTELLNRVVNSVRDNFDLYYVGIFLLDEEKRYAVLTAGTGEAGEKMIAANHRLEIGGTSMIGWCISNRKARIALDVGADQIRFNNLYLPSTRSEMALPVVFQDQAIGALTIQSAEANAFQDEDIMILQGIADSLAIALENARLFQQTQQALDELRVYNQNYIQDTWGNTLASQGNFSYSFQNPKASSAGGASRELNIPVTLRDQQIGQISLETADDSLSNEDHAFLDAILTQTALALENARLLEETQRRAVQEQKLNDLSTQLSKASSIEYILQTAARELGQLPMVSEVAVQLVSSASESQPSFSGSNGNEKKNNNGHGNGNGREQ